jgi:hypothetical protein
MKPLIISILTLTCVQLNNLFSAMDYRDNYCGNYAGRRTYKYVNAANTLTASTNNYTISVSKGLTDSTLTIGTMEGVFIAKLLNNQFRNTANHRFYGKFSNDSIYLNFIPSAGPNTFNYVGKK